MEVYILNVSPDSIVQIICIRVCIRASWTGLDWHPASVRIKVRLGLVLRFSADN